MTPIKQAQVELLMKHFMNRVDTAAVLAPWGKPAPAMVYDTVEDLVRAHVIGPDGPEASSCLGHRSCYGHPRVGSYTPAPDGTTKWLCFDFDGADHSSPLADPLAAASRVQQILAEHGLPSYLERSGGGKGWHVWVFFAEPIQASIVRTVALALCPDDVPLANGKMAEPRLSRGIEVFPKADTITKGGYGNMVWLPFFWDAPPHCNAFHVRGGDGELAVVDVPVIEAVAPEHMESLAATLAPQSTSKVASVPARRTTATLPTKPATDSWKSWRSEVLQRLDLHAVYGQWLTGASRPGWLECRDPESPTGDQHPSAGVADGSGQAERGSFHSFRTGITESVFDFLVRCGGQPNFAAAAQHIAQISNCPMPLRGYAMKEADADEMDIATSNDEPDSSTDIVVTNVQLKDLTAQAWAATLEANQNWRFLFTHGGRIVRVDPVERRLRVLEEVGMIKVLTNVANWYRLVGRNLVACKPDTTVARDMLLYPSAKLPVIDALVHHPIVSGSGAVIAETGYYAEDRVYVLCDPSMVLPSFPPVLGEPEVAAARETLLEPLREFCFVRDSDRAHMLAALILPFVRHLFRGPTPLHVFDASAPGSGKTLLTNIVGIIATGEVGGERALPSAEDEVRKAIVAELLEGRRLIVWDNIPTGRVVDSPSLASALTSTVVRERVLGESRGVTLVNQSQWMMTGNNLQLSSELTRRAVHTRVEPLTHRPEDRVFAIPNLLEWVKEHRASLIHATLVLVRAWINAGRPRPKARLGSYEAWVAVVGGVLEHAGVKGFLEDREERFDDVGENEEWAELVAAWQAQFGVKPVTTAQVLLLCEVHGFLVDEFEGRSPHSCLTRLGILLKGVLGRVFVDHVIRKVRYGAHRGAATYHLEPVGALGALGTSVGTLSANVSQP